MKSLKTPKMMLVCVAILLVSATSMAAISLSQVAVVGTEPVITITIGVNSDDDQAWLGYIFIEPGADGWWVDDVTIYPIAGDLAYATVQDWYELELIAAGFNNLPQPGLQFTADLEIIDDVTVYLAEDRSSNVVDTLDLVIPEPVTMSLLGLGGLLIRRRRV